MSYDFINAYNLATTAGNSRMELKEAEIANLMKLLEQTNDPLVKEMCEEKIARHYSIKVAQYQKEKQKEEEERRRIEKIKEEREHREAIIATIHAQGGLTNGECIFRAFTLLFGVWWAAFAMDVGFYWIELPLALIKWDFHYFGYFTQKYWRWVLNK